MTPTQLQTLKTSDSIKKEEQMKQFVIAWCLVFVPVLAQGATYHVAKTCTGGGACTNSTSCAQAQTVGTAKLTIAAGIACMSGGDTVSISNGTYAEVLRADLGVNIPSGTSGAPTTIKGKDGFGGVIVMPNLTGSGLDLVNKSWITIQDLTFDGANQVASENHVIQTSGHNTTSNIVFRNVEARNGVRSGFRIQGDFITLTNIWTHDNGRGTGQPGNGVYYQSGDSILENSIIENNAEGGVSGMDSGAGENADNVIVRNTIIRNNGHAAIIERVSKMTAYNNVIYNNTLLFPGWVVIHVQNAYNNTIHGKFGCIELQGGFARNNICLSDNTVTNVGSGTFSHNLCNKAGTGCTSVGTPQFINAAAGNYQLQPSATSAINQGTSTAPTVTTDFAGVARPQGTAYDLGAYEFVPAGGGGPTGVPGAPTGVSIQ